MIQPPPLYFLACFQFEESSDLDIEFYLMQRSSALSSSLQARELEPPFLCDGRIHRDFEIM